MTFGTLVVVREVERTKYNRRFECRCTGCGSTGVKWLSNLLQGKYHCLTCIPWEARLRPSREAIVAARKAKCLESDSGRICLTCQIWKPWDRFSNDSRRDNGKTSNCMECGWWRSVKGIYGLSQAEWTWLRDSQQGLCALCRQSETRLARLSVDHDHSCCGSKRACKKCIRGMLCSMCNRLLGHVDSRPALAPRFADYLEQRPFLMLAARAA